MALTCLMKAGTVVGWWSCCNCDCDGSAMECDGAGGCDCCSSGWPVSGSDSGSDMGTFLGGSVSRGWKFQCFNATALTMAHLD